MMHKMNVFIRIWNLLSFLCKIGIINTLRINFRIFNLKDAVKLPVIVFRGTELHIGKNAKINMLCVPSAGILRIGALDASWLPHKVSNYVSIDGIINISGKVRFSYNSHIVIGKNAVLSLLGENYINHDTRVLVHERVTFEYGARVGWNTQLCDSAFHYVEIGGIVTRKTKPIIIGREAWVSSFCNVGRGAYLPANSVLSNCSLLNKDYSASGTHLLIAGIPAKIIKTDVKRIMESVEPELCDRIDRYFRLYPEIDTLKLTDLNNENW